jgi:hypothetical protein
VPTGAPPVPPTAYSATNASAESGTDTAAARPDATTTDACVAGSTFRTTANTSQAPRAVTSAMSSTFRPRADSPPSANSSAWTTSTTATHTAPTAGPTSTAASAPPRRWPDVPEATGKLSICTANTNAATSPASGTRRSSRTSPARCTHQAMPPAATTAAPAEVGPSMNPSGMCIPRNLVQPVRN